MIPDEDGLIDESKFAMKPTQAQIEAVKDVLRRLVILTGDSPWDWDDVARKVLAAAAEVGEQNELESGVLLTKAIDEVIAEDVEKERLQTLVSQGIQIERQLRKELLRVKAATIERCAQVAEKAHGRAYSPIAAAIRALRDRP